jgi:hypothetical protein
MARGIYRRAIGAATTHIGADERALDSGLGLGRRGVFAAGRLCHGPLQTFGHLSASGAVASGGCGETAG